ncbi:hypothetical protein FHS56_001428 [Thermonema lapsum]|uniref:YeeE/YedE family protein n=1 Tax=Thermonema lapsum TaxID=28195 RepID=A0A846MR29_9BACT|nr:DUF6691 family protein [Thermonema lapsum]NIK73915.1 hypothetical protein [Thermonema lapsum]
MKVTHKPAAEQKKKVLSPQLLSFFVVGIAFGIIMVQAEIISWFRIFEMFHFYSFHMYGVIGTAVVLGIVIHWLIRKGIIRNVRGERIVVPPKAPTYKRYLLGGTVFGLGWALTGACPGPMFIGLGAGFLHFALMIGAAVLGTMAYGFLHKKLPH